MITVRTHEFEGRTRTHLNHQNVAEVGDELLRGLMAAGEKAKYKQNLTWLPVRIPWPDGAAVEPLDQGGDADDDSDDDETDNSASGPSPFPPRPPLPPLLQKILDEYSASGAPPAYLPKPAHPEKGQLS